MKSFPRYLLIVLALAGDSTMTRFLASVCLLPPLPDLLMANEKGAGEPADHVPQLQIRQTRQKRARFKAAAGAQLLQGNRSVPGEGAQARSKIVAAQAYRP